MIYPKKEYCFNPKHYAMAVTSLNCFLEQQNKEQDSISAIVPTESSFDAVLQHVKKAQEEYKRGNAGESVITVMEVVQLIACLLACPLARTEGKRDATQEELDNLLKEYRT